jgi:hypothetical protein
VGLPLINVIEMARNRIYTCAQRDRTEAATASTAPLPGRGGIALIEASFALIRDNWIALNGASFVPSICGIWFGVSMGLVLEQNEILDNGPRIITQQTFEAGPRAGIRVEFAFAAPTLDPGQGLPQAETEFPAMRAHDNVVIAPSGPALAVFAGGPVSVADNELTAGALDTVTATSPWLMDKLRSVFGGSAVFIFDFGQLSEASSANIDFANIALHRGGVARATATPAPEFVSGDVQFNNNRVLLNFGDPVATPIISSVALASLADIGIESNQFLARTGAHTLATNVLAISFSVRFDWNRCQDRFDTGFSGFTVGFMNTTTDNHGKRCFYAAGQTQALVDRDNSSLIDTSSKRRLCAEVQAAMDAKLKVAGYARKA